MSREQVPSCARLDSRGGCPYADGRGRPSLHYLDRLWLPVHCHRPAWGMPWDAKTARTISVASRARVRLQLGQGLLLIFFDAGAGQLDLFLGSGAASCTTWCGTGWPAVGALPGVLKIFWRASRTRCFVVGGGAHSGGGDIGARFFHGTLVRLRRSAITRSAADGE